MLLALTAGMSAAIWTHEPPEGSSLNASSVTARVRGRLQVDDGALAGDRDGLLHGADAHLGVDVRVKFDRHLERLRA